MKYLIPVLGLTLVMTTACIAERSDLAQPNKVPSTVQAPASGGATQAPAPDTASPPANFTVSFENVRKVLDLHCAQCHSRQGGRVEEGVSFDSHSEIKRYLNGINKTTVRGRSMPPRNGSGMTQEERSLLGQWISSGASK